MTIVRNTSLRGHPFLFIIIVSAQNICWGEPHVCFFHNLKMTKLNLQNHHYFDCFFICMLFFGGGGGFAKRDVLYVLENDEKWMTPKDYNMFVH